VDVGPFIEVSFPSLEERDNLLQFCTAHLKFQPPKMFLHSKESPHVIKLPKRNHALIYSIFFFLQLFRTVGRHFSAALHGLIDRLWSVMISSSISARILRAFVSFFL
jgi:hypothetical protein